MRQHLYTDPPGDQSRPESKDRAIKLAVGRSSRFQSKPTPESSQMVLLAATGGRMVLALALAIVLGRYLLAEEFGYFVLVTTIFTVAHELTDLGSGNLAMRETARSLEGERDMVENLLGLRLALGLVAAACCVALALAQASWWHKIMLLAAAPLLVLACVSALNVVFQVRQRILAPVLLSVFAQFGTVAACMALLEFGAPGALFAVTVLAREIVVLIGTRQMAVRLLGYAPRPRFKWKSIRPFLGKAAIMAFASLFYGLQFEGGIFAVWISRPAPELGAFAAAYRPLVPVFFIPWLLMTPLVPLMSWLAANRREAFRRQARVTLNLCIGFGAVLAVAAAEAAPAGLQLLYGLKYSDGALSAIHTLRWLAPPLGYSFAIAAIATILLADNRERQLLWLSIIGFVLYICANLALLPRYQFTGSAIASTLGMSVTILGCFILLRQGKEHLAPGWQTAMFLLPATVLFGLLHFLTAPPLPWLALAVVASAAALFAVWRLPGVAGYRAEQANLSRLALDGAAADGALEANG